jgi:hypothetical protein
MVEGGKRQQHVIARRIGRVADVYSTRIRNVGLQEVIVGAGGAAIDRRPVAYFNRPMVNRWWYGGL